MQNMGLNEIREKYLSFFESKGHMRMRSFSLIPKNDPSILLINAGMTPLKPYFTGAETPPSLRMTTCQKCIRTPDIERVGKTARHGTYFEMLGNFSFGDYFKVEAIRWAWEFCTEVLQLPVEKLAVTVYLEDDEAYDIWKDVVGLPESKIFRMGKEDNFWEHGVGPCGPCSEIFYDRGPEKGCQRPECNVGCDCDRYVEFWNLVFTQFNREGDGTYTPLVKKNIDTGGGLERFACIMQNVDNLFEVDTVRAILDYVCSKVGVTYGRDDKTDVAIRVITDHARSTVMMISDGIIPDNAGRGYVLRRLLRRASRYARILGKNEPFLYDVASIVIRESASAYPELKEKEEFIRRVILKEEESFAKTVNQGSGILAAYINEVKDAGGSTLSGEMVFKLHDTFGFPLDLTREIAAEQECDIDEAGFFEAMSFQKKTTREIALKNRAGAAWANSGLPEEVTDRAVTDFTGYNELSSKSSIKYLIRSGETAELTDEAGVGDRVTVISDLTPFYAQSGGQSGDTGTIHGSGFTIRIEDTRRTADGVVLHSGVVEDGVATSGARVTLEVDKAQRMATARNHTTTHLLHKALQIVLGDHVAQAGSDVSPLRLRFDFSHFSALTPDEKERVEKLVNDEILADDEVVTKVMSIEEAKETGAMALFDEKYSQNVRVVSVGGYSKELCGGTHLDSSSQACLFKIVSEAAVAAGVRRIEGVTGAEAMKLVAEQEALLKTIAETFRSGTADLAKKSESIVATVKSLEKRIESQNLVLAKAVVNGIIGNAEEVAGIRMVFAAVESENADDLRNIADMARDQLGESVVLLASVHGEKVSFVCMASKTAVAAGAHAGNLVKEAAVAAGGGGGGRPDMAQAGGKDKAAVGVALRKAKEMCLNSLKK
ncbi:MAG: alanine--tRNA ligase [Saccharofermentanales bacterium]